MKNFDEFMESALRNITEDRAAAKSLLTDVMLHIKKSDDRQREFGLIAAKYLETLQRSNEQMVKLTSLMHRRDDTSTELTEEDKQKMFDAINQDKEES